MRDENCSASMTNDRHRAKRAVKGGDRHSATREYTVIVDGLPSNFPVRPGEIAVIEMYFGDLIDEILRTAKDDTDAEKRLDTKPSGSRR